MRISAVLDASAFLAYLHDEPGAQAVADAISAGAAISTVNLAEALSLLAHHGLKPEKIAGELRDSGLLDGALRTEPLTLDDAVEIARLRPVTRKAGLSLGDRACLALARRLSSVALTADKAWASVKLDVSVTFIR